MAQEDPRYIVYLVHGTWSRKSRWIAEDSEFSKALAGRLGVPLRLRPFRWSGKNSFSARESAAEELSKLLFEKLREFPLSVHVVIAHSHGGNIALRAIADEYLHRRVVLVCLSTPFLNVRKRRISSGSEKTVGTGALMLACLLIAGAMGLPLIGWLNAHGAPMWLRTSRWVSWMDLKTDDAIYPIFVVPLAIAAGFIRRSRQKAELLWEKLRYRVPEQTMLKILRTRGDEASAALSSYQLLSWVISKIVERTSAAAECVERFCQKLPRLRWVFASSWKSAGIFRRALVVLANAVLIAAGMAAAAEMAPTVRDALGFVFFSYVFGLVALPWFVGAVLGVVLALMVAVLCVLGLVSVGSDAIMAAVLYDITPESTPEGNWEVCLCAPPERADGATGLMHSAIYENPAAWEIVAGWMEHFPAVGRARAERSGDVAT